MPPVDNICDMLLHFSKEILNSKIEKRQNQKATLTKKNMVATIHLINI